MVIVKTNTIDLALAAVIIFSLGKDGGSYAELDRTRVQKVSNTSSWSSGGAPGRDLSARGLRSISLFVLAIRLLIVLISKINVSGSSLRSYKLEHFIVPAFRCVDKNHLSVITVTTSLLSLSVESNMAQRKVAARSIVQPSVVRLALIGATSPIELN